MNSFCRTSHIFLRNFGLTSLGVLCFIFAMHFSSNCFQCGCTSSTGVWHVAASSTGCNAVVWGALAFTRSALLLTWEKAHCFTKLILLTLYWPDEMIATTVRRRELCMRAGVPRRMSGLRLGEIYCFFLCRLSHCKFHEKTKRMLNTSGCRVSFLLN